MSHAPNCGRATPRWSVAGQALPSAALNAGLSLPIACVGVGPPLSASDATFGSVFCLSPSATKLHVLAPSMLWPPVPTRPKQSCANGSSEHSPPPPPPSVATRHSGSTWLPDTIELVDVTEG